MVTKSLVTKDIASDPTPTIVKNVEVLEICLKLYISI